MKHLLLIITLCSGTALWGQGLKVVNADSLSEAELSHLDDMVDKEGWVQLMVEGRNSIRNFSNKDYILSMYLNCQDPGQAGPQYLIEYSRHYRDGSFEFIDFSSSQQSKFDQVIFKIDNEDFGDPFSGYTAEHFSRFRKALQSGKSLTISFYGESLNPDTGESERSLNRSIDFKLGHGTLLNTPVDCNF